MKKVDLIRNELDGAILEAFQRLKAVDPNTGEYANALSDLEHLYRMRIEEDKQVPKKERDIERILKYTMYGAEIGLPLLFYTVWMATGFKFEETGTYCSPTFKGLIKFFRPTKR